MCCDYFINSSYMIIEFGKKDEKKMLFVHSTLEQTMENFISQCGKAYQTISKLHSKFYHELQKYQSDKQTIIKKIMCLAQSYEVILLQICGACQTVNLTLMGKIVIKMHLQSMEIIKWLAKNLGEFSAKSIQNSSKNLNEYESYANQLKERQKKNLNYYYRVKENSIFTAKGIDKELDKMSQSLKYQQEMKQQQIKNLLTAKQFINRIQPSQSEQILLQAVQIIARHGQVFKKITKENKQNFIQNFRGLNIKPYSKVKNQIEESMKEKMEIAMKKMWITFKKFIDNKNLNGGLQTKVQTCSYGTQANIGKDTQQKYHKQDKKKTERLKQALANVSYHKSRAEKLEQLLRHKATMEQRSLKQKHENMLKKTEKQIPKKSYKELTSLNKINDISQKHLDDRSITKSKRIVDFSINPVNDNKRRKMKTLNKKIDAYQKSLSRIQFNIQNQNGNRSQSSSSSLSQKSIELQTNMSICRQQINLTFDYTYLTGTRRTCLCGIPLTERSKNKNVVVLSLCTNVFQQIIKSPNLQIKKKVMNRNKSLLTITNLKSSTFKKQYKDRDSERQSKRDSAKIFRIYQSNQFTGQPLSPNSKVPGQRRNRKQMTELVCFSNLFEDENNTNTDKQKMIHIVNKPNIAQQVIEIIESSKQTKIYDEMQSQQKNNQFQSSKKNKNAQINNNFQLLSMNINEQPQLRNKRRVNAMMTELKKKRLYKQGLPGEVKRNYGSAKCSINIFPPSILLDLYFKQQNAMEAQIQYGVSVSNLIVGSRKVILKDKNQIDPKIFISQKHQQYIQQMTKNIQRSFMVQRQKNPKIYKQLQTLIKYPLSTIKGSSINEKQKLKDDLTLNEIKNFVRFISNLHAHCEGNPCQHFTEFLMKINVKIN